MDDLPFSPLRWEQILVCFKWHYKWTQTLWKTIWQYPSKLYMYRAFQTGISLLEFILQIDPMCTKIYVSTSSLKHCLKQQKTGINLNIHYQGTGYINSNEPKPQNSMHYIKRTQEINIIYYGIISKDRSENSRK